MREKETKDKRHGLTANRNYKDTIFRMIFKEKKAALELYNAVNSTCYDNADELEIVTLENAIYMAVKNDVAVILDYRLNLYEHQSTICPNMPLRNLVYVTSELEKLMIEKNLYVNRLVKIPTPSFIVFYNGLEKYPESQILKLSDAFEVRTDDPQLELKVKVMNINAGYNENLKEKSKFLREYMIYVDKVRLYSKDMPLDKAVCKVVDECISEDILKEFLLKNKMEVVHMSIFEYDEEDTMRQIREAEFENGREEGREETRELLIISMFNKGYTSEQIADVVDITEEEVEQIICKGKLVMV